MSDQIKNINETIFSCDEQKIVCGVKNTISYCKMLLSEIKNKDFFKPLEKNYIKHIILDHMYIAYYCFKCIGIMKLVSKMDIYNKVDHQIETYLETFLSSNETHKIFSDLKNNTDEDDEDNEDELWCLCYSLGHIALENHKTKYANSLVIPGNITIFKFVLGYTILYL